MNGQETGDPHVAISKLEGQIAYEIAFSWKQKTYWSS